MARHNIAVSDIPAAGQNLLVTGEEAHHASRVKRLQVDDLVGLRTGRGRLGEGRVASIQRDRKGEWLIEVCVESCVDVPRPVPDLVVRTGVPKGDKLEQMVESLSQVGASGWGPLGCALGVVDPREGKIARLARVANESMKQCGRAWALEIEDPRELDDVIGPGVIVADASGGSYRASGDANLTLLVGPEGGFTPEEIGRARGAGCTFASFGEHTMRVETAAVVAAGIVMDLERNVRR